MKTEGTRLSLAPSLARAESPMRVAAMDSCFVYMYEHVHRKIKETLLIKDLKPALNENVGSEKRFLY